ncbi:MAG: D-alanyl-D-alanine carboxypeptidase/D-alanyl-D-alanine-endopeptidase [Bacteroidales bacterium]|nr:D-alanyl-D-alanine carboxypeptidase/D-alanyl-D-alanine-endopeptidase [Bacteroidales bacterium]
MKHLSFSLPSTPVLFRSLPTILLFSFFTFHFSLVNSLQAQPTVDVDRAVRQVAQESAMKHATLSVSLYNVTTGKKLYGYDDQRSVTPASVEKLLTTGVGFALLGSDFRFTTRLTMRGEVDRDGVLHGNLYITGDGDPLLGSYRYRQTTTDTLFAQWTSALRKRGVRRIDGGVCYNTTVFDDQRLHDSWQWGDVGNYYGAGVSGLNFHENMYFVHFNPGNTVGTAATVSRTNPKGLDLVESCTVTTGAAGSGDNVIVYGAPNSNQRLYTGTVPLGKRDFGVRAALPDPARACADLFASYLRTRGIGVSLGATEVHALPDSLRNVMDYHSTPYRTLAQYTNHTSNNIYAESIFKYLGYKKYGRGTFVNGAKAVMDYLGEKGLATDGLHLVDGSGLSRQNRVTADFLCRYLEAVSKEAFFDHFLASLAKAGENGTAKNLLPSLPQDIGVHVKTGSMEGVKSYAGYITTSGGELLAFAIIANNFDCSSREAGQLLAQILQKIAVAY